MRLGANKAAERAGSPGEPLFHLDEIASRVRVSYSTLRGLMTKPDAPKPFRRAANGVNNYYRLSEFRKWPAIKEMQQ